MRLPFEYTYRNHAYWSYSRDHAFILPDQIDPDRAEYWFGFTERSKPIRDWRYHAKEAASLIADRADRPITLMLSGGIDSEAMFHAFRDAGELFDCTVMEYQYGMNRHEVDQAQRVCDRFGIKLNRFRMNPFRNWYQDHYEFSWLKLDSNILYDHVYMSHALRDKFQVWGGGNVVYAHHKGRIYVEYRSSHTCMNALWVRTGQTGVELFHCYTPEQTLASITDPELHDWIESNSPDPFYPIKFSMYARTYPEIVDVRPKWKGMEAFPNHHWDFVKMNRHSEYNRKYLVTPIRLREQLT